MNRPDLRALVAHWQEVLRLRDWRIEVEYVRRLGADEGSPCYGLCTPFVDAKSARIRVNDPATPHTSSDPSVEETIVHELLHLHVAPLAQHSSAGIAAEEQAVWAITDAIMKIGNEDRRVRYARAAVDNLTSRGARRAAAPKGTNMETTLAVLRSIAAAKDPQKSLEGFLAALGSGGGGVDPVLLAALTSAAESGDAKSAIEALVESFATAPAAGAAPPHGDPLSLVPPRAQAVRGRLPGPLPIGALQGDELRREVRRKMGIREKGPAITRDASGRMCFSLLDPLRPEDAPRRDPATGRMMVPPSWR